MKANRMGLMRHDMQMSPTVETLSRKPNWPFKLNHFGLRFRGRKPDPGPLFTTITQLWTHKEPKITNSLANSAPLLPLLGRLKGYVFSGTSLAG
eukprot:5420793-Amphidinium_carterae.1